MAIRVPASRAFHAAVEDHARIGAPLVLRQEFDDRLAADLLLAVRDDPDVDRKGALGRKLPGGVQEHPELPLVVGHPSRVQPLVADRRLERIRLPELERRRRLDVEMAVAEDRRGTLRSRRGADLADDQRALAVRHELRLPAPAPDLVGDPFGGTNQVVGMRRIGAHGLDAQKLAELVEPGCFESAHRRESRETATSAVPDRSFGRLRSSAARRSPGRSSRKCRRPRSLRLSASPAVSLASPRTSTSCSSTRGSSVAGSRASSGPTGGASPRSRPTGQRSPRSAATPSTAPQFCAAEPDMSARQAWLRGQSRKRG